MEITKISLPLDNLVFDKLKQNKAQVKKHGTSELVLSTEQLGLNLSLLSDKALKVIKKLQDHNFKAYFVGGCIRDLLLGKKPKDFDVSTDATPEQVRSIFANSRIIGRRFKIVHVVFGYEIIEVTTFRSNQEQAVVSSRAKFNKKGTRVSDKSGMILRDNVYGKNIVEDSLRRDFTINALYLDPIKGLIYDYNGGMYDLKEGLIDIIGDPKTRYSEDPVRMIRALRFSAKLGFKISKRSSDPIKKLSCKLLEVSNARMFEEVNKIFLSGHGHQSFMLLKQYQIFELLFPATKALLDQDSYEEFVDYALLSSDERYKRNQPNMPHFLYSVILWQVFYHRYYDYLDRFKNYVDVLPEATVANSVLDDIFDEQETITSMPFAVSNSIRALWRTQLSLEDEDNLTDENKIESIKNKSIFRAAFDFLTLRSKFDPFLSEKVDFWKPYYDLSKAQDRKLRELQDGKYKRKATKKERLKEKNKCKSKGKSKNIDSFDNEERFSKKRKAALEKAKAWRAAMNLSN